MTNASKVLKCQEVPRRAREFTRVETCKTQRCAKSLKREACFFGRFHGRNARPWAETGRIGFGTGRIGMALRQNSSSGTCRRSFGTGSNDMALRRCMDSEQRERAFGPNEITRSSDKSRYRFSRRIVLGPVETTWPSEQPVSWRARGGCGAEGGMRAPVLRRIRRSRPGRWARGEGGFGACRALFVLKYLEVPRRAREFTRVETCKTQRCAGSLKREACFFRAVPWAKRQVVGRNRPHRF